MRKSRQQNAFEGLRRKHCLENVLHRKNDTNIESRKLVLSSLKKKYGDYMSVVT